MRLTVEDGVRLFDDDPIELGLRAAGSTEGTSIDRSTLEKLIRETGYEPMMRGAVACD